MDTGKVLPIAGQDFQARRTLGERVETQGDTKEAGQKVVWAQTEQRAGNVILDPGHSEVKSSLLLSCILFGNHLSDNCEEVPL